jgi:glycosyltransferase involved in cell wall biosynthesis
MRILLLHSRYLSGPASGENRVVEEEAALLRSGGHHVWRYSPEPTVGGPVDRVRSGVSAIWSTRAVLTVRRLVEREGIEVVHAHNVFPTLSPAALRAAHDAGAATLVTLHNFRLFCLPANLLRDGRVCEDCVGHAPWRGVRHRCYRGSALGSAVLATSLVVHRSLGTFDGVSRYLAVSDFVRRKHVEAGLDPSRIAVKPNFVWPLPLREGPGEYFLFLGRLAPEKGVDTLLAAWALGEPPGKLVIAGDGPEAASLRAASPPGVEFRGQVAAEEVPSLLASARALVIPSRWYEAAPRTITEAYAAGVPVLASDIGALPEAVQAGTTGYLVPVDDPNAWAQVARRLADDAESERLGAEARRLWSERFTPEHGLAALEAQYAEALATRDADRSRGGR